MLANVRKDGTEPSDPSSRLEGLDDSLRLVWFNLKRRVKYYRIYNPLSRKEEAFG